MIKVLSTAVLALSLAACNFEAPEPEPGSAYLVDSSGYVVRNGFGECVRTGYFKNSLATKECDPDLVQESAK